MNVQERSLRSGSFRLISFGNRMHPTLRRQSRRASKEVVTITLMLGALPDNLGGQRSIIPYAREVAAPDTILFDPRPWVASPDCLLRDNFRSASLESGDSLFVHGYSLICGSLTKPRADHANCMSGNYRMERGRALGSRGAPPLRNSFRPPDAVAP
jgi:hypothetical protein